MKTVEEHEKEKRAFHQPSNRTGVQCPHCGSEMLETNPGMILLSNPPRKSVHCDECKYATTLTA